MGFNPWEVVPGVRRRYALRFFSALVVVVLIVGVFGGYIYVHTGDELQSDVQSQLVTDAEKDSNRLDIWFESTEQYLLSLPRSTAIRANEDRATIADSLQRMNDRTAFRGAYHVDAETGDVLATAGTSVAVDDDSMNDAIDERVSNAMTVEDRVVFSDAFETSDGRPAMVAVSKVPGENDRVIVGLVDLESLSRYMIGDDATDDVVVIDERGTVVLAEDRSRLLQADTLDSTVAAGGTGPTSGAATGDSDETVVGYAALENADWTLTTRTPATEAYSLQSDISNQILAMIAVVFGSMVLLGATIGRNTAGSLRRLSQKAAAIEEGTLDEPVESTRSDELGDLYRSVDRMRRSLRERITEAEAAQADAERAREESEAFSKRLERTADRYGETMRACADGDLTRRLEPDAESDAMAQVAAEFNAMMNDIETTVAATRAFAEVVDDAAESTADGVVEVRSASEQVTTSVQQIADGADRQSDQLAAIGTEMGELSTMTEEIAATSSQVATLAARTAETSANARESARRAIDGMNAIESEADDAVAEVERLEREIEAIDDLLEFIGEVTEETNLLALNANIEAARSKSDEAEFNTVAEQVKSLAEDTQEAATDVENRLERVRQQTDRVADVVKETDDRITEHRSAVEDSVAALEEISEFAEETNDGIQEISAASQQQAVATQEVVTMTDDVTAISEETSAEAETVAAAAEEQTSSLIEVSHTATSLSERARELDEAVSAFEVSVDSSEMSASDPVGDGELPADVETTADGNASEARDGDDGLDGKTVGTGDESGVDDVDGSKSESESHGDAFSWAEHDS